MGWYFLLVLWCWLTKSPAQTEDITPRYILVWSTDGRQLGFAYAAAKDGFLKNNCRRHASQGWFKPRAPRSARKARIWKTAGSCKRRQAGNRVADGHRASQVNSIQKPLLGGYAALMLKFVLRFWTPRFRANPRCFQRYHFQRSNSARSRLLNNSRIVLPAR